MPLPTLVLLSLVCFNFGGLGRLSEMLLYCSWPVSPTNGPSNRSKESFSFCYNRTGDTLFHNDKHSLDSKLLYSLLQSISQQFPYTVHVWDSNFSELTFTKEVMGQTTKTWITFLCPQWTCFLGLVFVQPNN